MLKSVFWLIMRGKNDQFSHSAKIANKDQRQNLLLKVAALKNSQLFSRVYINRDLTKQQRDEVVSARRQRLRISNQEPAESMPMAEGSREPPNAMSNRQRGRGGGGVPRGGRGRGDARRGGRQESTNSAQLSFGSIPHVRNF